jgi:hypothetical protein
MNNAITKGSDTSSKTLDRPLLNMLYCAQLSQNKYICYRFENVLANLLRQRMKKANRTTLILSSIVSLFSDHIVKNLKCCHPVK